MRVSIGLLINRVDLLKDGIRFRYFLLRFRLDYSF